jgi:AGZA family xanthine/uracil permease-like MFS transporter
MAAVPQYATAPVLVLVGVSMFQMVLQIEFARIEDALPSFFTLVLIPLTFSITQGILCGFVLHAVMYACVGRARELPVSLWLLAAVSAVLLGLR